jgi:hypothetical protein
MHNLEEIRYSRVKTEHPASTEVNFSLQLWLNVHPFWEALTEGQQTFMSKRT